MHKFGRTIIIAAIVSSMVFTPVYAAQEQVTLQAPEAFDPGVDTNLLNIDQEADLDSLRAQLTEMLQSIDQLERAGAEKDAEIVLAEQDLADAEEREREQHHYMMLRIKYHYEDGGSGVIMAILQSDNLVEALNRAEYANEISNYDRDKILEYVATQNEIKALKSTLETEKNELIGLRESFLAQQQALNDLIAQKEQELEQEQLQQLMAEALASLNEDEEFQAIYRQAASTGDYSVLSTYSKAASYSPTVWNAIMQAADAQRGVGYVYGAQSPGKAFDCSGFVRHCYAAAGIDLPHSSGAIAAMGTKSTWDQVEVGDVLWKEGHVMMYAGTDENGQMLYIDSKTEGTVIDYRPVDDRVKSEYTVIKIADHESE